MSYLAQTGSFALNTSTGNQQITGVGFPPSLVLFYYTISAIADGLIATQLQQGFGAAISSSSRFTNSFYFNGTNEWAYQSATKCLGVAGNPTLPFEADFISMDTDGFTINVTTAPGTAVVINYIAYGGTELNNVAIKQFQTPTGAGNQTYTGVGFKPDAILFSSISNATLPLTGGPATSLLMSISAVSSPTARGATANSTGGSMQVTNKALQLLEFSGPTLQLSHSADLVSFNNDGFTLNYTTATTANYYVWGICFKGGKYTVGNFTQPASTGIQSQTGLSFIPVNVLFFSQNKVSSSAIDTTSARFSMGSMSGAANRGYIWNGDTSTTDTNLSRTDAIGMITDAATPVVNAEADFSSFDGKGFSINWSSADATAREIIYFAAGPGTYSSFKPNALRPRAFAPGLAR